MVVNITGGRQRMGFFLATPISPGKVATDDRRRFQIAAKGSDQVELIECTVQHRASSAIDTPQTPPALPRQLDPIGPCQSSASRFCEQVLIRLLPQNTCESLGFVIRLGKSKSIARHPSRFARS
jgi:hypothetical protein